MIPGSKGQKIRCKLACKRISSSKYLAKAMTETVGMQGKLQRFGDGGSPKQVRQRLNIPPELQAEGKRRNQVPEFFW